MVTGKQTVTYETKEIERLKRKLLAEPEPQAFEEWQQTALNLKRQIQEIHALETEIVGVYNVVVERGLETRKGITGKRKEWSGQMPSRLKPPRNLLDQ